MSKQTQTMGIGVTDFVTVVLFKVFLKFEKH